MYRVYKVNDSIKSLDSRPNLPKLYVQIPIEAKLLTTHQI